MSTSSALLVGGTPPPSPWLESAGTWPDWALLDGTCRCAENPGTASKWLHAADSRALGELATGYMRTVIDACSMSGRAAVVSRCVAANRRVKECGRWMCGRRIRRGRREEEENRLRRGWSSARTPEVADPAWGSRVTARVTLPEANCAGPTSNVRAVSSSAHHTTAGFSGPRVARQTKCATVDYYSTVTTYIAGGKHGRAISAPPTGCASPSRPPP